MTYEFRLPDLGEGIAEAEVRSWLVKEGDRVEEHQNVALLETDKAVIEVPTPRAGVVVRLMRGEGETLRVGEALMSLEVEAAANPAAVTDAARDGALNSVVGQLPEAEETVPLATPGVRALARERGIPLGSLEGTGPLGSVTREDLQAATAGGADGRDQFGEVERVPLSATRKAIGARLRAARSAAAYVSVMSEVDVTELWSLRSRKAEELAEKGIRLSFMPFIMKALALALPRHPSLNAEVDDDHSTIVQKRYVNLGIAVDGPEGLLVPVLRDIQRKSIVEIAQELPRLAERARKRELSPAELKGSSFTISNFGSFGGRFATPIPNYPDVAILGCGAIEDRPWVVGGALAIRSVLPLSLTFDHRASDGGDAARFLSEVGRYLGDPANLIIEGR
jgi:pyruvate dehydrogenase E2 component (dihydrolipoamide acetyltransferase)